MLPYLENHCVEAHFGVDNKLIKAKKRQLERVRRQKINEKLEKLKVIVLKQMGNDVGFYPPMEKADILELAIRCLESKEETSSKETVRKPFERLENNISSPNAKLKLETTPIRKQCLKTTSKSDENTTIIGQFPAEFKPLLQHPIRSFSKRNDYEDVIRIDQSNQSPVKAEALKYPIWRPWTL